MKSAVFICVAAALLQGVHAEEKVDFATSIQPILEKRCIECHSEKKTKGDLRLDQKNLALKAGDGKVISAGKADESALIKRVSLPADHDDIMPPKGDPLSKEQIELLTKWINQGANWPDDLVLGGDAPGQDAAKAGASTASKARKKAPGEEFAHLKPTENTAQEQETIKKLAAFGVSVRPIAQNLQWKETTVRPQDTNKTGEVIARLADVPSLVDLNLAKLNLSDDDVKPLARLTNLQRLHLENNPLSDAALEPIKGLVNLEYLNLYNTKVTDAGIDHLKGLTNLMALYLWQTEITDQGAEKLRAALPATMINRGEELKLLVKADEKKEEAPAEEKKAEEK